ncbi:MAG: hypothetical protein ACI4FV_05830 [Lachnospiraceae bacterium]
MNQELEHAPKGSLKIIERKGRQYYYHQYYDKEKCQYTKHYIKKEDEELAKILARKGYNMKVKKLLEQELKTLQIYEKSYNEQAVDDVYDSLSEARKNLIHPVRISAREQLRRWNNDCYEPYQEYQEDLIFETDHGEKVRSKSELIIANILFQNKDHLLYKYEKPLELVKQRGIQVVHPDFTVLNIHTGKITYWEHAGRMDDPRYANQFVQKMNLYLENNIFQGENLIVTYETMNFPLNIQNVKTIIQRVVRS